MTAKELLESYAAGERNFSGALLRELDLRGANLAYANFTNANLLLSNLRGANLMGADFTNANLKCVNFIYTNLRHTNLQNANLQNWGFTKSNLQYANLQYANLEGVDLKGINLLGVDFSHSSIFGIQLGVTKIKRISLEFSNFLIKDNFGRKIVAGFDVFMALEDFEMKCKKYGYSTRHLVDIRNAFNKF